MSSRVAYPFLTLSEAAVEASPWLTAKGHEELTELTDFIPDWDYATSLRLRRSISVDREAASAELELAGDDMVLGVGLRVGTGPGRMPRAIIHHEIRELPSASPLIEFDFEVPGEFLSSVLHLQTDIILLQSARSGGDLSPRLHGDRLWRDDARSRLEGEEPRFPIEVANFKHLLGDSPAASAPWYLHWAPSEWSRDFHGSIRLYLNSEHKDLIGRVEGEDPETLRYLMADVMGQVCESLVRDGEIESVLESCEPGSLGAQASLWLDLAFPGCDLPHARSVLENRPGVFRAAFQAVAELKGSES